MRIQPGAQVLTRLPCPISSSLSTVLTVVAPLCPDRSGKRRCTVAACCALPALSLLTLADGRNDPAGVTGSGLFRQERVGHQAIVSRFSISPAMRLGRTTRCIGTIFAQLVQSQAPMESSTREGDSG